MGTSTVSNLVRCLTIKFVIKWLQLLYNDIEDYFSLIKNRLFRGEDKIIACHFNFCHKKNHGLINTWAELRPGLQQSLSGLGRRVSAQLYIFLRWIFFLFLQFFFSFFLQKYMVRKNLWNYTSSAVGDGGRDLPPCPTAVGGTWYCSVVLPPWATTVGFSLFSKICIFLFELEWR
jgi:hypothetical protein